MYFALGVPLNIARFLILFIKTFIILTTRALYKQLIAKYPQYKDKIIYDYKKSLFTNLEFPQDPVRRHTVFFMFLDMERFPTSKNPINLTQKH